MVTRYVSHTGVTAAKSHRKAILDDILGGNFSSFVRPVKDDSQTTQVSLRMTFHQIRDLVSGGYTPRVVRLTPPIFYKLVVDMLSWSHVTY